MRNLITLDQRLNEASSMFKHAVQTALKAAGYNLKQSEVKVGAKKERGMGTKITLNGEMIGFDDDLPKMIASFTKSIEEDPEKYGLKESVNERNPNTPVKKGDILYMDGRKGKVVKVMSDMANVDFGRGDVYGIMFNRIEGDTIGESLNEEKYKLEQLAGGEWIVVDSKGTELARERNRINAIRAKKDLEESVNEGLSNYSLLDFFKEMQSFPAAGVDSEDIKDASKPKNKKKTVKNTPALKSLLDQWMSGRFDEDPGYLVNELRDLLESESVKFKNLQPLNEFGPMTGSGNRHMKTRELVDRIGDLEDMLWDGNNRRAEKEWEIVSGEYLTGEEGAKFWGDLEDHDLRSAIDDAELVMKKYKMKEPDQQGGYGRNESVDEGNVRVHKLDRKLKKKLDAEYDGDYELKNHPDKRDKFYELLLKHAPFMQWDQLKKEFMNLFKINYAGTGSNMGELLEYFYNMVRKELKIGESVNEADQMHGEYLMQMLKAQADDLKKQGEHKTAAAMMYLWDRINQSARDKDIDAEYVHDFLNEPRGRKHSLNLPEWMILDLFVESFIMKEDLNEGSILVWDEMEKPFEDLKSALDKVSKENTDPKWSKALLSVYNQIHKAQDNLNNYDRKLGAITIKESADVTSISYALKNKGKVRPNDETIKFHIDSYKVDDDPYDVAKEIGAHYNWTEREIEKAEKIIRKKYLR